VWCTEVYWFLWNRSGDLRTTERVHPTDCRLAKHCEEHIGRLVETNQRQVQHLPALSGTPDYYLSLDLGDFLRGSNVGLCATDRAVFRSTWNLLSLQSMRGLRATSQWQAL
jgi:hypothetical protein